MEQITYRSYLPEVSGAAALLEYVEKIAVLQQHNVLNFMCSVPCAPGEQLLHELMDCSCSTCSGEQVPRA